MSQTVTNIGTPAPPPHALVVAVSERTAGLIKACRNRKILRGVFAIIGIALALILFAVLAHYFGAKTRTVAFSVFAIVFVMGLGGLSVSARQLEIGLPLLSRSDTGGLALFEVIKKPLLLFPMSLRYVIDGILFTFKGHRNDVVSELAAWILLALLPSGEAEEFQWFSLEGAEVAGVFEFPYDLKIAVLSLLHAKLIEVDKSTYPAKLRITAAGLELIKK